LVKRVTVRVNKDLGGKRQGPPPKCQLKRLLNWTQKTLWKKKKPGTPQDVLLMTRIPLKAM